MLVGDRVGGNGGQVPGQGRAVIGQRLTGFGGPHGFGEQHVQPPVDDPQPVQRLVRFGLYRLIGDQVDPRGVQQERRTVSGVRRGGLDVGGDGGGCRGHGCLLRTAGPEQRAGHVRQPGERAAGEYQHGVMARAEVQCRRRSGAGRTGQHHHVGTGRPDAQGMADQGGHRGDHRHGQHAQPRRRRRPVAEGHSDGEAHCDHAEVRAAIQVWAAAAVQRGESADGGDQSGRGVAGQPAHQNGYGHADSGAQRERPPARHAVDHEDVPQRVGRRGSRPVGHVYSMLGVSLTHWSHA